ncbi:MAG TPA: hypothetical protein VGM88_06625 [Kofleriaceae bacterium]|jgi:hypothetical protein
MSTLGTFACAAIAMSALVGCSSSTKKRHLTMQEMIAADPLPLAKGARWTYQVTVRRFDVDADKEITQKLSWTTEVVDAKDGGNGVVAYRVRGWPTDLADMADSSATPHPSEQTILRSGNNFLFSKNPDPVLDGAEGWFSWPVMDGQKICPSAQTTYCWQVAAVDTGYTLSYYTGPDEQTYELEPGTGVARFHYAHHGTTNEVEAKLVGFAKGAR